MSTRAFGLIAICTLVTTVACSGTFPTSPDTAGVSATGPLAALPSSGSGLESRNNESATYTLQMQSPTGQKAEAPNGDVVTITCVSGATICGTFSTHPKSLPTPPSGEFVHADSDGNVLGGGTWTATELLSFQPYGCGVVRGNPTPQPNFCGGALKLRVELTTALGTFDGILDVFCIIGPNPPNDHDEPSEEGATLNIIGVINFNHTIGGGNRYVKTS